MLLFSFLCVLFIFKEISSFSWFIPSFTLVILSCYVLMETPLDFYSGFTTAFIHCTYVQKYKFCLNVRTAFVFLCLLLVDSFQSEQWSAHFIFIKKYYFGNPLKGLSQELKTGYKCLGWIILIRENILSHLKNCHLLCDCNFSSLKIIQKGCPCSD